MYAPAPVLERFIDALLGRWRLIRFGVNLQPAAAAYFGLPAKLPAS